MIINSKKIGIKISLLSPEQVLNISYGKLLNSKTLNYKNFKPEPGGLFCDKIFGSSDKSCYCGKTFSYDEENFICRSCGVETSIEGSNFKRNRFGHIMLNNIALNPLYYKIRPSYLSIFTGISFKDIIKIINNDLYLVLYTSVKVLKLFQILCLQEYIFYKKKYNNKFYAEKGVEGIYYILKNYNIKEKYNNLENFLKFDFNYLKLSNKKKVEKYKILRNIYNLNINPLNIFIKNILVLPPDLRPIVKLPNENIVSSDLNELYKRIIDSSNRLKKIKNYFGIPFKISLNEKKILQDHINNLFIGSGTSKDKPLKSLMENLKGKAGFFRKNLLGKRVDYSGRAVITSGANLKFGECAIPKTIAMELFRPFIYSKILLNEDFNIQMAKHEVDRISDLAVYILLKILKNTYVLLNRAPTLHRLGMQAFKVLLTDEKAIKLHPLVCAAYNADFDGDQMAIHIPISVRARVEYKTILFSGNNVLYPANGSCCIAPTKDILLGIYYFTKICDFKKELNVFFNSINEAIISYNYGYINLNTKIFLRFKEFDNYNKKLIYKIYETTLSRALIFNCFPLNCSYGDFNKNLTKKDFNKIFNILSCKYPTNNITLLSDNIMKLGFNYATYSGSSISIDDIFYDYKKKNIFKIVKNILISYNIDYLNFLLTRNTKRKKILELWDEVFDIIFNSIMHDISFSEFLDSKGLFLKVNSINSLHDMLESGARGSITQIKQICCNRGLIDYKKSGFFETPVLNSLRDGLNVFEYFYFSHNSRKTLADTALKTASAGYLTRRLVEVANNVFISEYDCKTNDGLIFKTLLHCGEIVESFEERILGRTILDDFFLKEKNIFIKKNTLIDYEITSIFKNNKIFYIKIRSPLKCKANIGVCSLCYGVDLSTSKIAGKGVMVGIIAAQAIGEPGTQLTMRTFHSGGAITKNIEKSFFISNFEGTLKYSSNLSYVLNRDNIKIVISEVNRIKILDSFDNELEHFDIPYGSNLFFENNSYIEKGALICKWDSKNKIKISEFSGFIKFLNLSENLNFMKRSDIKCFEIINNKNFPCINIMQGNTILANYFLSIGDLLMFDDNSEVEVGDILIKNPIEFTVAADIIGGLPKINNLFEARAPKNSALLSPVEGFISFEDGKKNNKINIIGNNNNILFNIILNKRQKVAVFNKQYVNKGDIIINGEINPHDILYIHGVDHLVNFLLEEIKYVYSSQGVKINDKHLEIIICQMLKLAIVVSPGKSDFLPGEILLISEIENFNKDFHKHQKIKYDIVLTGITNKSLKNPSFLSAASFQRTSDILSAAAINSNYDDMTSLKNIVMVGDIFIAGSGSYSKILNF